MERQEEIDKEFESFVADALDELESAFPTALENVAVVVETDVRRKTRDEIRLRRGVTLLGLYQGVPKIERSYGEPWMLPDKITLFIAPIADEAEHSGRPVRDVVRDVVWHEVAHALGLDEHRARASEHRRRSAKS
jgi:predicted Zn-dependent protease with MMP-like domain